MMLHVPAAAVEAAKREFEELGFESAIRAALGVMGAIEEERNHRPVERRIRTRWTPIEEGENV